MFRPEGEAAQPDVVVGPDIFRPEAEAGRPDACWMLSWAGRPAGRCHRHALDDPTHLERGMEYTEFTHSAILPIEVANAEKARKKAISGLKAYELKPEGMSGSELLDHAIAFRLRKYADTQKDVSCVLFLFCE